MENIRDAVWVVEYIPSREDYRISRFTDPNVTVAYEDYWSDAVKDIIANYGSAVKLIQVRKQDGTISHKTYNL